VLVGCWKEPQRFLGCGDDGVDRFALRMVGGSDCIQGFAESGDSSIEGREDRRTAVCAAARSARTSCSPGLLLRLVMILPTASLSLHIRCTQI